MVKSCRLLAAMLTVSLTAPVTPASVGTAFQFEVLGASDDWIVVRENIPASASDTAACSYPALDPSEFVATVVHFFPLSAEAKRGRLVPLEKPESQMTLYARGHLGEGCTSASDADRQWREITDHAKSLGVEIPSKSPAEIVLGEPVPAKVCVLLESNTIDKPPCLREFKHTLKAGAIRIAVSLTAIPEAPEKGKRSCQFVGHRFGVTIQVAGLDFGEMGSGVAPGGFANHYDCRSQQFDPLRLYLVNDLFVLVGGFSGTNIADRNEYPFVLIFHSKPSR